MGKKFLLLGGTLCLMLAACQKDEAANNEIKTPVVPDDEIAKTVSTGFYIVNEDWFNHDSGTVNRFTLNAGGDYEPAYRVFRAANPGKAFGITTQFAANWAGNLFFCSKQGARFVVADGTTLSQKVSIGTLGDLGGDTRAFVGVSPTKGYISSTMGVAVFDISTMTVGKVIFNVPTRPGYPPLYRPQPDDVIGNMCIAGGKLFVLGEKNLVVIDTATDQVVEKFTYAKRFVNSMVRAKDGSVWLAAYNAMPDNSVTNNNRLLRVDPAKLTMDEVPFDTAFTLNANWMAWNDGFLSASIHTNSLYWTTGSREAGFSIVRFDIDTQSAKKIYTLEMNDDNTAKMKFYGAALRVDPLTDQLVATVMPYDKVVTDRAENWIYVLSADGKLIKKFEYFSDNGSAAVGNGRYYWFPAMPLFDDVAPRVILNQVIVKEGKSSEINLAEKVIDPDNAWNTITTTISAEPDPKIATITREGDRLTIAAVGTEGQTTNFTVAVQSNGVTTEKQIKIDITK